MRILEGALRVCPAVTRLTVYRRLSVFDPDFLIHLDAKNQSFDSFYVFVSSGTIFIYAKTILGCVLSYREVQTKTILMFSRGGEICKIFSYEENPIHYNRKIIHSL